MTAAHGPLFVTQRIYRRIQDFRLYKFLNADVAHDILSVGMKFDLYEGADKVAFGKITEKYDCNLIP